MMILGQLRRSRVAALGIMAVLLLAVWLGPVSAYIDLIGSGSEAVEQKAMLLQRYRALAAVAGKAAEALPPGETGILMADVPETQIVAQLQETVKGAAAASQVQIRGFQVLRSETLPGATRFGVRVRAAGDVSALGRLLYAIAAARPLLVGDNLQVQAQPNAAASPVLEFQLDISGFKPGISS